MSFVARTNEFIRTLVREILEDECPAMAAEMAYHLMLAMFPTLIFLFTLFGMIGNTQQVFPELMGLLYRLTPPDAARLLNGTVQELFRGSTGELAFVSFIGAFIATSNGSFVVMRGLNRAYNISPKNSHYLRQRGRSLLITLGLAALFLLGANLLIFGDLVLNWLPLEFSMSVPLLAALYWLRWILLLVVVTMSTAAVYAFIPHRHDRRIHWQTTVPGALAFITLWLFISKGFTLYVENMSRYNQFYGAMGAVIVLMVWLYLTSLALLIGAEVNGVLDRCTRKPGVPDE